MLRMQPDGEYVQNVIDLVLYQLTGSMKDEAW